MMRLCKKWIFFALLIPGICTNCVDKNNSSQTAIENGLRYLESVQADSGEFPTTFTLFLPEPQRSQTSYYESILFTTAIMGDTLHNIRNERVTRIQKKISAYLQLQLNNNKGLWAYITTHSYVANCPYDVDDTVFASTVLKRQHVSFPDNRATIKANKNSDGIYLAFFPNNTQVQNAVDCAVNASVLSYLQENDAKVCEYINNQVTLGKHCGVFYTLPDAYYLIARSYASGISCLKPSMPRVTNYTLARFNRKNGSVENSPFKTAMALNTLLATGYRGDILKQAKEYLLKTQSTTTGSWPAEDFWISPPRGRSSSRALTTSIVLKALNTMQQQSL